MGCDISQLCSVKICLENESGIFHPPEAVDGHVEIILTDDLIVHEMGIWLVGQAALLWSENDPNDRSMKKIKQFYGGRQTLVKSYQPFATRETMFAGEVRLQAGSHSFPFHFHLPADVPSSFEATGKSHDQISIVQYKLLCQFHNMRLRVCHTQSLVIIVQRSYDLSIMNELLYVTTLKRPLKEHHFCSTQTFGTAEVTVNKTGFVPGESVHVSIYIANNAPRSIWPIYLLLKQTIIHIVNGQEKPFSRPLYCCYLGKCRRKSDARFNEVIHIPPVAPSELRGCSIINVSYAISALFLWRKRNAFGKKEFMVNENAIPIIIGTDPHREATFANNAEVVPCHAYFNHKSGEICEYFQTTDLNDNSRPVYRYYKPQTKSFLNKEINLTTTTKKIDRHQQILKSHSTETPPSMPLVIPTSSGMSARSLMNSRGQSCCSSESIFVTGESTNTASTTPKRHHHPPLAYCKENSFFKVENSAVML